jgi:hypothetical protein
MIQEKKIKYAIAGHVTCEDGSNYWLESDEVAILMPGDTLEVDDKGDHVLLRKRPGVMWLKARKMP